MKPQKNMAPGPKATPGTTPLLMPTLTRIARFYDRRKVGDVGPLGFRRSTDLGVLTTCADRLIAEGIIVPGETRFLDLGCADGRVNVLLSYLVRISVGIEVDAEGNVANWGCKEDGLRGEPACGCIVEPFIDEIFLS